MRAIVAMGLAAGLAGAVLVQTANAGSKLTGSQMRSIFSGKKFTGQWKGNPLVLQAFRNGLLRGKSLNRIDQGRWFIRGNHLCFSLQVWTKNKPKCGAMYKSGRRYYGFIRRNGTPRLSLSHF